MFSDVEAQCSEYREAARTSTSSAASNFPRVHNSLWEGLRDFYSPSQQTLSLLAQIEFALAEFE